MSKNYYDVLDEEEKHLGMAMEAFNNEELKKQWAISVVNLMVDMQQLQEIFNSASLELMKIIHSGSDKSVEKDFNTVMKNVRNSLNLCDAKKSLKQIIAKDKSVTACESCGKAMNVKEFRNTPESFETKWVCDCGKTFSETKQK